MTNKPIELYGHPGNTGTRQIRFVAKYLGIDLNFIYIDTNLWRDNLEPEFLKINPLKQCPTLIDDGFVLSDYPCAAAILIYLARKYANGHLYPSELEKRIRVSQRLNFDLGVLHQRFRDNYLEPYYFVVLGPEKLERLKDAVGYMEKFLASTEWIAGDELTIADFALCVNISNLEIFGFDLLPYPNIGNWYYRMRRLPGYEYNQKGVEDFKKTLVVWEGNGADIYKHFH